MNLFEPANRVIVIGTRYASIIGALIAGSIGCCLNLPAFGEEAIIGGGPDSDADGLSDSFEVKLGSDPTSLDSDNDGLQDGLEFSGGDSGIRTDPTESDTDSDGLLDSFEHAEGLNPIDTDSDNDGLIDGLEESSGTDPVVPDSDGDGLSDSFEVISENTNPLLPDTDEDGVLDSMEVWHGSDPLDSESFFVLPESPIGPIIIIAVSLGALVSYVHLRKSWSIVSSG